MWCNGVAQVPPERVVSVHDVSNIYHVPLLLLKQSEFSMSDYSSATSRLLYCHEPVRKRFFRGSTMHLVLTASLRKKRYMSEVVTVAKYVSS